MYVGMTLRCRKNPEIKATLIYSDEEYDLFWVRLEENNPTGISPREVIPVAIGAWETPPCSRCNNPAK